VKKRILSLTLSFLLVLTLFPNITHASINITDQVRTRRFLAAGLIQWNYIFYTPSGQVQANVIEVDMTNPNLEFRPIWSSAGVQQLATTQNIVAQNDAIAGINADFFAWASNVAPGRGAPIGGKVRDGTLITSGTHEAGAAAFFQYSNGTFGTDYLGATVSARHTCSETNEITIDEVIGGMNKFSDLSRPFVYTSAWGSHFRSVYNSMRKVVVEDAQTGIITAIDNSQGDLEIPPNGFIFVSLHDLFPEADTWQVGDRLEVATSLTPNINQIQAAIGAGTQLLRNGTPTPIRHGPTGRHPRSAIGTCANGTTIYLVTVDGRQSHSIGATLPELAGIMARIGAHSAVNLDGGGSTTMVAKGRDGATNVVNRPSENRSVANVIGIMSRGLMGHELHRIDIELTRGRIRLGESVNATVIGFDIYGNEWPLNPNSITITGQNPTSVGIATIRATYEDFNGNNLFAEVQIPVLEAFADVPADHWANAAITFIFDKGIMGSVESGNRVFAPNGTLSRAMVATILYRLAGEPSVSGRSGFDDVDEGLWFSNPIVWATENDIVRGMGDGKFMPSDSVTREQLAVMLYRFARFRGYNVDVPPTFTLSNFEDGDLVNNWSVNEMSWANHRGLITGMPNATIAPQGTATRAQCATILHRFMTELQ
jgi:exopolysaccharide biosynthesis protein